MTRRSTVNAVLGVVALFVTGAISAETMTVIPPTALNKAGETALAPQAAVALIARSCSSCHDAALVYGQRKTPDQWAETVQLMVDRGATLTPKDADIVIDYLVANHASTSPQ